MLSYDAPFSGNNSTAFQYLENMIRSAPPARLRLMLIERAVAICNSISQRWKANRPEMGCDEQTLHLRDILTELLSGVGRSDLPVALAVSDLYVFLSKHLTDAEMLRDVTMIDEIGLVLQTEAETWRIVCETTIAAVPSQGHVTSAASNGPQSMSLNLQG